LEGRAFGLLCGLQVHDHGSRSSILFCGRLDSGGRCRWWVGLHERGLLGIFRSRLSARGVAIGDHP
jgi:hypothetical protein